MPASSMAKVWEPSWMGREFRTRPKTTPCFVARPLVGRRTNFVHGQAESSVPQGHGLQASEVHLEWVLSADSSRPPQGENAVPRCHPKRQRGRSGDWGVAGIMSQLCGPRQRPTRRDHPRRSARSSAVCCCRTTAISRLAAANAESAVRVRAKNPMKGFPDSTVCFDIWRFVK